MIAIFTPIYDRVLAWSKHPHAQRYLVIMTMAESIFFPIPPDVMLAPMVLANRRRAWWLALVTTVASVLGGLIGYLLGYWALELVMPIVERLGYAGAYDQAVSAFNDYGIWFVILAGFSPIPFKLITIAAGALGMPWLGFLVGSVIGRGARFFMVAGIIYAGGERAAEHLRAWVDRIGWAVVALAMVIAVIWLTGCASTRPAPVVQAQGISLAGSSTAPTNYTVKSGESLYSIAFRYGLDWRDLARWNNIEAPYVIQAGQQVRLRMPAGTRSAELGRANTVTESALTDTRPLQPATSPAARVLPPSVPSPTATLPSQTRVIQAPPGPSVSTRLAEGINWRWPIDGPVVRAFDPSATRSGIGIQGAAGTPVVAAASGEVVYSGTALIGYGELIIIKHSDNFLSAYGYNRRRLVEEGVRVEAGAPIAEVGQSTDGQWQLHFEIRRDGSAVDPRAFLPKLNQ